MKTSALSFYFVIFLIYGITGVAQDLGNMSIKKRDSCLHQLAKKAILEYGEEKFLTEIKAWRIDHINYKKADGTLSGRSGYRVTYFYDTTKYRMHNRFLVEVTINKQTGKLGAISFGTGITVMLHNLKNADGTMRPISRKVKFWSWKPEESVNSVD